MGDDLEKEMKRIHAEVVEKKKRAVLKNLKGKNLKVNKQANRSLTQFVDVAKAINKGIYRKEIGKLSDRFVPELNNYEDLQALLQFLEGDLSLREGAIELKKFTKTEGAEKLVI